MVRTPDGKPAAGADVLLATKDSQVNLRNGRMDKYQHEQRAVCPIRSHSGLDRQ